MSVFTYYGFFAGGGMARAGLGGNWRCLFANDFEKKKVDAYIVNWGDKEISLGDIHDLATETDRLPGQADMAWASFPCQDLSLAGAGAGLQGERSSAFWGFYDVIYALRLRNRAPDVLVLENVVGLLTSNCGEDFHTICRALKSLGYVFGALVMDAKHFIPQSRPRLFIVAMKNELTMGGSNAVNSESDWTTTALLRAYNHLNADLKDSWRWWDVPAPASGRESELVEIIAECPNDAPWHSKDETARLIKMMSSPSLERLDTAMKSSVKQVGTIYKRTRFNNAGNKVQRAELRMDGVAGCLRTPGGGSSRQVIVVVEAGEVRSRLLSSREAARLMGLNDDYQLPSNYNEAYHLLGDGLAVPVVRHLGNFIAGALNQSSQIAAVAAE